MKFISPFYLNTLARKIKGDLYHDPLNRYLLSTDGSIFKDEPLAVIYPKSTEDVVETVRFARYHHLTVHPRGAGSGLCGSALGSGVVLDFSRYMHRLLSLDLSSQQFICEPGYRCGELSRTLKGSGLFFPPDPSSGEYASFGGMYATNASGAHSVKYGNVADYIVDAQIVLFTGEVVTLLDIAQTPLSELNDPFASLCDLYQKNASQIEKGYPNLRHNVAGYNLRGMLKGGRLQLGHLFSGAEGTLGVVTRLTFKLLPKPVHDSLVVAFFDNIGAAAKAVKALLPSNPAGIEVMDKSLLELARASDEVLQRKIPDGIDNVLLIEFDGETSNQTNALGQQAKDLLLSEGFTKNVSLATSENEKQKFWAVRKAAVPILYRLKGEKKILALIEDAVVPTDQLEAYFKGLYEILEKYKVRFVLYGHIAKGLIHTRPLLNLKNPAHIELLKTIADEVFSLVHGLGGVVSGEHGDGRLRSTYIARQYPSIYPFFVAVKEILDPEHMFNPDIKTSNVPDQMRRNLRYGEKYRRYENLPLQLNFDDGFLDEIEKCHGCSKCTTITTATRMCPIYKFTRLEAAAPKAKANVLRALISGAIGTDAIYEKTFQSIINLCVNCGSCKIECPSHVNIPQLALEARSRFVAKKGAPFSHHLLTRVETLGRLVTGLNMAPSLLKTVMSTRFMAKANEITIGLSAQRPFSPFAKDNLWKQKGDHFVDAGRLNVLYFAGCYAGYLRPQIGYALISVLNALDINVHIPDQHCCGLPLLTKGMTNQAKAKVKANLSQWFDLVDQMDYIVVTCSSCGLALMTEWRTLLNDNRIKWVENKIIHASHLIGRYLQPDSLANKSSKLAYHLPCHLKVQPHAKSSETLLSLLPGCRLKNLDSHCCGMAGTWGMTASNYTLSAEIGNHLISLINTEGVDGVVTDCPTCTIQLENLGSLPVYHPIEMVDSWMQ